MAWESTRPSDTHEDFKIAKKNIRHSTLLLTDEVDSNGYIWRGEKCIGKVALNQYLQTTMVRRYVGSRIVDEHLPAFDLRAIARRR